MTVTQNNQLGEMTKTVEEIVNEELIRVGLDAMPKGLLGAIAGAINKAMMVGLIPSSDLIMNRNSCEVGLAQVIIAFTKAIPDGGPNKP